MKPKIIHIVNLQSYGGIQKLTLELTSLMNVNGIVLNDLLAARKIDLLSKSFPQNVNVIKIDKQNFFSWVREVNKVFSNYDIIHFHGPFTVFQILAMFSKKKIIYTEHGTLQKANIKNTIKHFIQKRFIGRLFLEKYVDNVIFISKWIQNDLDLKNKNQIVVYNGLKFQEPNLKSQKQFVLTIAARLIPKKRVDLAIDVMHLLNEHSNVILQIIGDGDDMPNLKERAGSLLDKTVFFLGYRMDAYDIIASSDIYLMTTDMEPFGLVVLEAMMSETVVLVLANSGGPTEILNAKFSNLIVNGIDEMAQSILYWKDNLNEKKKVECELKELYAESYTMNSMAKNYLNAYLQVLENSNR